MSTKVSQVASNYNTHSLLKLCIRLNVPLSIFSKSQLSIDLHGKNIKKDLIHQTIQKSKIMIQDRTDSTDQKIFAFAYSYKKRPQFTEATLIKHDVSICPMLS